MLKMLEELQITPDDYQLEAFKDIEKLPEGGNYLVIWPTGCGKTMVAEYCIHLATSQE